MAKQSQTFYGASLLSGKTYLYVIGSGHVTRMAVMAKRATTFKNLLQNQNVYYFGTISMKHQEIGLYKVYINDDSVMTLTYKLRQDHLWSPMHFNEKNGKCHIMRKTCCEWAREQKSYVFIGKGPSGPFP